MMFLPWFNFCRRMHMTQHHQWATAMRTVYQPCAHSPVYRKEVTKEPSIEHNELDGRGIEATVTLSTNFPRVSSVLLGPQYHAISISSRVHLPRGIDYKLVMLMLVDSRVIAFKSSNFGQSMPSWMYFCCLKQGGAMKMTGVMPNGTISIPGQRLTDQMDCFFSSAPMYAQQHKSDLHPCCLDALATSGSFFEIVPWTL